MWQLLPEAGGRSRAENAQEAKRRLEAMAPLVPGILRLEVGVNCPEVGGNHDLVLSCDFASLEALDAYQKHPEHLKVGEFIGSIRAARAAVDYRID